MTDVRVQRSEKSFQVGMNKKDLMRDMGFELVLLDGECLCKWRYDRGHYWIVGRTSKKCTDRRGTKHVWEM